MTIELNREQEALLEKVLTSGQFESAEEFITYSLTNALVENDAFTDQVRAMLQEAQADKAAGRVVAIPEGKLVAELNRRRDARQKADDQPKA